ncbi:Electron transfer flavoprotein subunit beta [bacterium HR39]|nr:Electron transfer flavoprotein subunit beta [bacterium HR39]
MKVLVPVKRVVDPYVRVRIRADGSGVDIANLKMAMNPFDEIAVEEAVRWKERGIAEEVVTVSIGEPKVVETLRTALAMGADRAIAVQTEVAVQPLEVAKMLRAIVEREQPRVVIMGKQAVDDDSNQTGQMLAALLGWAQATFASRIDLSDGEAEVAREVDEGIEVVRVKLPAVITVDLRLNEPRYASLPNIMKAKRKPVETLTPADLGVDPTPRLEYIRFEEPPKRQAGRKVESVRELVEELVKRGVI